ncbi:MAG: hypothetical protein GX643_13980 [Acidimicrobiales bacterium]|nr:hypothetical protein [Acidimicrobiales bacterium]
MSPTTDAQNPADRPAQARIGLLKCGTIRTDLIPRHGDYPELFGALLGHHPLSITTYDAEHGELPRSPGECDGWLVSGSANSVYDDEAWIDATGRFLSEIVAAGVPLVAVCFGHQLLAQALGGEVRRSERGWGVGVHRYDVTADLTGWPGGDPPAHLDLLAMHQDQVTRLPEGATVLASSEHCPVAAYSLGERVLAVQAHPEFTPELTRELIEGRIERIGSQRAEAALAELDRPIHGDVVADWFAAVLTN